MLDVIIDRHTCTWNCQRRTHIHTKIHAHTHTTKTPKKVERVGKKEGRGGKTKRRRWSGTKGREKKDKDKKKTRENRGGKKKKT